MNASRIEEMNDMVDQFIAFCASKGTEAIDHSSYSACAIGQFCEQLGMEVGADFSLLERLPSLFHGLDAIKFNYNGGRISIMSIIISGHAAKKEFPSFDKLVSGVKSVRC